MESHCIEDAGESSIKPAVVNDVSELARLFEDYRAFYGQAPDPARVKNYVADEVATSRTRFFVARDRASAALGFVHLIPATNTLALRPIWYLEDLFVDPAARRRGVAEALMREAERFAIETGAERLTLATAYDNFAAQALYRKLGYSLEDHFVYFHRLLP